jgi:hypothetical protein
VITAPDHARKANDRRWPPSGRDNRHLRAGGNQSTVGVGGRPRRAIIDGIAWASSPARAPGPAISSLVAFAQRRRRSSMTQMSAGLGLRQVIIDQHFEQRNRIGRHWR